MRPLVFILIARICSIGAAPLPSAAIGDQETPLSVQTEIVRELSATLLGTEQAIEQLNATLDTLENEVDPGAELDVRVNDLAREIETSNENLVALRAQTQDPAAAQADVYAEQLTQAEQSDIADQNELASLRNGLRARQTQLQHDSTILERMVATNIPSEERDQLQAKVDQERIDTAQLENEVQLFELGAATASAERHNNLEREQRGDALAAEQDLERATNDELRHRQQLQQEYASLQKIISARETARNEAEEKLRTMRIKYDRVTAELERQRELLAQIAHS